MARVAKVNIKNFRGISSFEWLPKPGFNCLLGAGDSGKSSILEAIGWCLSGNIHRSVTDADFHGLRPDIPIEISVVLVDLSDRLLRLETYGPYHRGFNQATGEIDDEPGRGLDTAFSITLRIDWDMQGRWSLDTNRVEDEGDRHDMALRALRRLSLLQLQDESTTQLTFSRGSVLFKLAEETLELNGPLADASRQARNVFGGAANEQLEKTLEQVRSIANNLGISAAAGASATLDASQMTLRPSNIALHDQTNVPLTRLGLGSSRLLIAGLQQKARDGADIGLIDELESGLEPHRIVRLLQTLGAKHPTTQFQVFATTHSPVVVRELSAEQLLRVRNINGAIETPEIDPNSMQGVLRMYPEAFLSQSVVVCEGAGEVGLLRGLDLYRIERGYPSLTAHGTSLVNAGGYGNILSRAEAFHKLGYRVAILRDDDAQPNAKREQVLLDGGCLLAKWPEDFALEHAIFRGLPSEKSLEIVRHVMKLYGSQSIEQQVNNHMPDEATFDFRLTDELLGILSPDEIEACISASMAEDKSWLKKRGIGVMEEIAYTVIGPALDDCQPWMKAEINKLFDWAADYA